MNETTTSGGGSGRTTEYLELMAENADLRRWAKAWKSCARGYHDKANVCICTYCGHESNKDRLEILEHMLDCDKRPDKQLWQALAKAVDDMNKLESENAALRQRVQDLEAQVDLLMPYYEWTCSRCGARLPSTSAYCPCRFDGEGVA